MTTFQLLLMIVSAIVFYMFFKQLFSGDHPKRGVDFEAQTPNEQIGGISEPDKIFSRPTINPSRMDELLSTADDAVEKGDFEEAKKALQSALIVDENSIDALRRAGYVFTKLEEYDKAEACFVQILKVDESDDMAHASLANILHKQGKDEEAQKHHERAIELDSEYAAHHFNYANTLYDLGRNKEALLRYSRALELDSSLETAKEMIKKLSE